MGTTSERRRRKDRRQVDLGPPPGCFERRHSVERRLPQVDIRNMSEDEWLSYFGDGTPSQFMHSAAGPPRTH